MSYRTKVTHMTQSARKRRQALLRLGVWIFLCVFAFSVVGGIGLIAVTSFSH
jgi:hypothetical protein